MKQGGSQPSRNCPQERNRLEHEASHSSLMNVPAGNNHHSPGGREVELQKAFLPRKAQTRLLQPSSQDTWVSLGTPVNLSVSSSMKWVQQLHTGFTGITVVM